MLSIRGIVLVVLFALGCSAALPSTSAQQPPNPEQQSEFIPIDELPPQEQLPAAPLLVAAYVFVVVALFLYLLSLARRLSVVQREVERLEADLKRTGHT
jgi:CcmD family protein